MAYNKNVVLRCKNLKEKNTSVQKKRKLDMMLQDF